MPQGHERPKQPDITSSEEKCGRPHHIDRPNPGLATPADAAMAMQLGAESVFVGSGIFKSSDPAPRAKAIVEATTNYNDPVILAKVSRGLGTPMTGIGMDDIDVRLADRGW